MSPAADALAADAAGSGIGRRAVGLGEGGAVGGGIGLAERPEGVIARVRRRRSVIPAERPYGGLS